MKKVCFNGEYVQIDDIQYKDLKRGFSFGDGAFETIKVINGKPVFLKHHLKRLNSAIEKLKLCPDQHLQLNFIEQLIIDLLQLNEIYEGGFINFEQGQGYTYLRIPNDKETKLFWKKIDEFDVWSWEKETLTKMYSTVLVGNY